MPIKLAKIVNVPYYTVEGGAYEILQLWFDWVKKDKEPTVDSGQGDVYCYFCSGDYMFGTNTIKHEDDCIHQLTEEYLHPTTEESK